MTSASHVHRQQPPCPGDGPSRRTSPASPPNRRSSGRGYLAAMSVIDWLLEGDPAIRWQVLRDLTNASADDVAAERARVEHDGWGRASSRSRIPTGSGPAAPASRRPTPAVNRGSPGRPRCTRCRPCSSSGSTRRRRPPGGRSCSSRRTGAGSTPGSGTSTARSSRASTAGRSRPARTSGSTSHRSSSGSSPSGSMTAAGTARSRTDRCGPPSTRRSTCSTACSSSSARPAAPRRCARPGAAVRSTCSSAACSAARARGGRPTGVSRVRVSVLLALRRAPRARLLPTVGREPGSPDGGGGGGRAVEAAARRPVAARPHPSGPSPLRSRGRRGHAEPLEHPSCPAGAQVVRLVGVRVTGTVNTGTRPGPSWPKLDREEARH